MPTSLLRVEKLLLRLREAATEAEAAQLGAQTRAELQQLAELADKLEDAAGALDDDSEALAEVARQRAEHRRLQQALRTALLDARRAIRSHDDERRAALLAGGSAQVDRTAVQSAVEITETLRRTRQLMANEVARSEAALSNLNETGGALRDVLDEHGRIADSVASGSRTMSRIKRREATDKLLNMGGLCFFLLVVAHIFGRRLMPFVRPIFWRSTPSSPPLVAPARHSPLEPATGSGSSLWEKARMHPPPPSPSSSSSSLQPSFAEDMPAKADAQLLPDGADTRAGSGEAGSGAWPGEEGRAALESCVMAMDGTCLNTGAGEEVPGAEMAASG